MLLLLFLLLLLCFVSSEQVAATGRTVMCTIHQPSAEIFFMFDRLLLLQKGGRMVYFGSVEDHAKPLVRYLEAVPGTPRLEHRVNPADWMLNVIGSGVALSGAANDLLRFPNMWVPCVEAWRLFWSSVSQLFVPTATTRAICAVKMQRNLLLCVNHCRDPNPFTLITPTFVA